MKKKMLSWVAVLCFLLTLSCGAYASGAGNGLGALPDASAASALTERSGLEPMAIEEQSGTCGAGLTWKLFSSGKLVISGYGEIVPPSAWMNNASIQSVEISSGVTSIGSNAFWGCMNLKTIQFPTTLKDIGQWVCSNCSSLGSIVIPDNVVSIGNYAFNNCASLSSVKLGAKVSTLGDHTFSNCSALNTIKFGKRLSDIGQSAFLNCVALTSLSTPNSLNTIGEDAFRGCENLEDVSLAEGLTSIGPHAFMGCSSLASISLPESVHTIGAYAFPAQTLLLINRGALIETYLQSNRVNYKYLNKITSNTIKLSTATKVRTVALNARAQNGASLTYTSKDKKILVSSAGVVTIPKNYVGNTTIVITAAEGDDGYAPSSQSVSVSVTIPKATVSKVSSPASKTAVVKWKAVKGISGYQLEVSSSKNFLAGKQIKLKLSAKETNITVVRLNSKSTYYVRIRALQNYNGTKYGPWSSTKKVKVK